MVNYSEHQLDLTFSALAHSTRRAILKRLAAGDCSVGELAEPFDISLPAVSKHLRVLERAGLVQREKDGRVRRMHLDADPVREANEWIDVLWNTWGERFDRLAEYLERGSPVRDRAGRPDNEGDKQP